MIEATFTGYAELRKTCKLLRQQGVIEIQVRSENDGTPEFTWEELTADPARPHVGTRNEREARGTFLITVYTERSRIHLAEDIITKNGGLISVVR